MSNKNKLFDTAKHFCNTQMVNSSLMINIALGIGLAIFTFVVFKLGAGAFTIVMAAFAAIVFALILLSPDEKEKN